MKVHPVDLKYERVKLGVVSDGCRIGSPTASSDMVYSRHGVVKEKKERGHVLFPLRSPLLQSPEIFPQGAMMNPFGTHTVGPENSSLAAVSLNPPR